MPPLCVACPLQWGEKVAKREGALAIRREADAQREEHALFLANSHQRVASVRERKELQVRSTWGERRRDLSCRVHFDDDERSASPSPCYTPPFANPCDPR